MSVRFKILPETNLVYVLCSGEVTIDETLDSFSAYAMHKEFKPGQNQMIDLSQVTGYERDFPRIMALQAEQADVFLSTGKRPHLIFVAPTPLTQSMAMTALRSWQQLEGALPVVVQTIPEALDILGLDATIVAQLPSQVA
ncbi:hypothetical protein [Shimia sp. SDUM112013]|uniref:hypothetical protein n=1 Tax=Shimia sp. SDUM112013 TaxID=3136160 RepID=UPI0032EFC39B